MGANDKSESRTTIRSWLGLDAGTDARSGNGTESGTTIRSWFGLDSGSDDKS